MGKILCPVLAILAYLPAKPSPPFLVEDGASISHKCPVAHPLQAIPEANLDTINFSRHSFRIEAVSTVTVWAVVGH